MIRCLLALDSFPLTLDSNHESLCTFYVESWGISLAVLKLTMCKNHLDTLLKSYIPTISSSLYFLSFISSYDSSSSVSFHSLSLFVLPVLPLAPHRFYRPCGTRKLHFKHIPQVTVMQVVPRSCLGNKGLHDQKSNTHQFKR